jgi:hypothetical protein
MKDASRIHSAKGKKINHWNPKTDSPEEILADVIGPSGNLRAPTWRLGNEFLVGFNNELYQQVFNS